jgi:hypothetical protein
MVTASMRFSARALALPAEVRGTLADRLLQSLDGPDQKSIDALWAKKLNEDPARSKKVQLSRLTATWSCRDCGLDENRSVED